MSRMTAWLLVACALCLSTAAAHAESDDPATYRLAYKFEPNQFVHYEVDRRMTITTRFGEASETTSNHSMAKKHYRVVAANDDGGVIEPVIDEVQMEAKFGDNPPTKFNSTSAAPPPKQFRDVVASIGKPLVRLEVSPSGRLKRVIPLEGENSVATDPSQNILAALPEEPVRVGDKWSERYSVKVNVSRSLTKPILMSRTYKLESVEGSLATISVKTYAVTPVNDPAILGQLVQRTPSGTIRFDLDRGVIVTRELEIDETEIGVFGPNSSIQASSHSRETLIERTAAAGSSDSQTR